MTNPPQCALCSAGGKTSTDIVAGCYPVDSKGASLDLVCVTDCASCYGAAACTPSPNYTVVP